MNFKAALKLLMPICFVLSILGTVTKSAAQNPDSTKRVEPLYATASLNINNNGISLFPNFSLGKPAAIVNLYVGKKNISFEPEFRWGLNGKPWSYIYWLRYRIKPTKNFEVRVGTHLSYVFKETPFLINGNTENRYVSQRYFAGEISPSFKFSDKFSLGFHYLYSKGLDKYVIQNSHFISFQPHFPNFKLNKNYSLSLHPQLFYLVLDDKKGSYVSESLSINKKNLPISLTSMFTYKINSTIAGGNTVWNVGFNFKF